MTLAEPRRLAALVLLLAAATAWPQPPDDGVKKAEANQAAARLARMNRLLEQPLETNALQGEMTLAQFLAVLELQLPRDKQVRIRFDEKAFGKELAAVRQTPVKLPPFPKRMSLATVFSEHSYPRAFNSAAIRGLPYRPLTSAWITPIAATNSPRRRSALDGARVAQA